MEPECHKGVDKRGAQFSDCRKYRYFLFRIWDETKPLAMCIGLNPSTANESEDDTTITNLRTMLMEHGYGGFYMMNLFALISPDPNDLRKCPNPWMNNDHFLKIIRERVQDVIFCWGAFKQAEYTAKKVSKMFPDSLCFGKNRAGKPLHPLAASIWMRSEMRLQRF